MPKRSHGLPVETPSKVFGKHTTLKSIDIKFKDLFKSLGKAISSLIAQRYDIGINNLLDAVFAFEIKKDDGQLAWLLINRSIIRAIAMIVEDNQLIISEATRGFHSLAGEVDLNEENLTEIADKIDYAVDARRIVVDDSFFTNPRDFSLLEELKQPLAKWFEGFGLNQAQSESISGRFTSYFVFALNEEWREKPEDYKVILDKIDTPFKNATKIEESWNLYNSVLQKRLDEPMFGEAFSLRQIYIPLRAYIEEKVINKTKENSDYFVDARDIQLIKKIIDVNEYLDAWVKTSDKSDSIRFISGGPGYGKSSSLKIFAGNFSRYSNRRILYIPLHLFQLSDDLEDSINHFVRNEGFLSHNIFDNEKGEKKLLIIFDGLDELSMQGKVGDEIAKDFVRKIQLKVVQLNQLQSRLKIIICGRDISVQSGKSETDNKTKVIHLLPYYLDQYERFAYEDVNELLKKDQRDLWWENYGKATGQYFTETPFDLTNEKLNELTLLPLFNYLVALSYTKGKINFKTQNNINVIYYDLLESVYQRGEKWADKQHIALEGVSQEEFIRVLEEIGLAAWQGESRKVSVQEIERHCSNNGLYKILEKFKERARGGISTLLLAFYFRKSGNRDLEGNDTFEFTHKSFGEYLTARRVVRGIERINYEISEKQKNFERGWDDITALVYWIELTRFTAFDDYLIKFISDELELRSKEEILGWQKTISKLINYVIKYGTPMEKLADNRPSFKEEMRQARNVEESLLVCVNSCAKMTQEVSPVFFTQEFTLNDWLRRLNSSLAIKSVGYLNLIEESVEKNIDESEESTSFRLPRLFGKGIYMESLERALYRYKGARTLGINLERVNLEKANLEGANLKGANLEEANLGGANLEGANLEGANLKMTKLTKSFLQFAILKSANLEKTKLEGSDIREVNMENVILKEANLFLANLEKSNLTNANLEKSNLELTNFTEATLKKANFIEANLEDSNLRGANLREANLTGANLKESKLDEAKLEDTIWQNGLKILSKISINHWLIEDGSHLIINPRSGYKLINKREI